MLKSEFIKPLSTHKINLFNILKINVFIYLLVPFTSITSIAKLLLVSHN